MDHFFMGAMAMASAVAGLFFLRFWRDTGDRLFAIFALAFWLLGMTRIALAFVATSMPLDESRHYIHLVRAAAYVLIIIAIVDKNRPRNTPERAA